MRLMSIFIFCAVSVASPIAAGQEVPAGSLCKRSQEEVAGSQQCTRWWFACYLKGLHSLGKPEPRFANIPFKKRQELLIQAAFSAAENNCTHFSYQEAEAAMRGKLRTLD